MIRAFSICTFVATVGCGRLVLLVEHEPADAAVSVDAAIDSTPADSGADVDDAFGPFGEAVYAHTGGDSQRAVLAIDDDAIWLCDGDVVRVPKVAGSPTVVATGDDCGEGLVVVAGKPYWISGGYPGPGGSIHSVDATGTIEIVVASSPRAVSLAVANDIVYWVEDPDGATLVRSQPVAGGTTSFVAMGLTSNKTRKILAHQSAVWFFGESEKTYLYRVGPGDVPTLSPIAVTTLPDSERGPSADLGRLYWVADGTLWAKNTAGAGGSIDIAEAAPPGRLKARGIAAGGGKAALAVNDGGRGTIFVYEDGKLRTRLTTLPNEIGDLTADASRVFAAVMTSATETRVTAWTF